MEVIGFLFLLACSQLNLIQFAKATESKTEKSPKFGSKQVPASIPPFPPEFWSANPGECANNPSYDEDCVVWAEKGYCFDKTKGNHYPKWMARNCMRSCKICEPAFQWWQVGFKAGTAILGVGWVFGLLPFSRGQSRSKRLMAFRLIAFTIIFGLIYYHV